MEFVVQSYTYVSSRCVQGEILEAVWDGQWCELIIWMHRDKNKEAWRIRKKWHIWEGLELVRVVTQAQTQSANSQHRCCTNHALQKQSTGQIHANKVRQKSSLCSIWTHFGQHNNSTITITKICCKLEKNYFIWCDVQPSLKTKVFMTMYDHNQRQSERGETHSLFKWTKWQTLSVFPIILGFAVVSRSSNSTFHTFGFAVGK